MSSYRIPKENPDLRKYLTDQYLNLFVKWGIIAALLIVFDVVFLFEYVDVRIGRVNAVAASVILPILPFFVFKGHRLVFDRSWEGKVIKIEYTSKTEPITKYSFSRIMVRTHYCDIYAELPDSSVKQLTIKLEDVRTSLPIQVGERVRHYPGFKYPLLPDHPNRICPVCGHDALITDSHCLICKHSLIKNPDATVS